MRIDVLIGTAVDGCSLLQIKGDGFDHAGEDKDGHSADEAAVGENNAGNGLEHGQTDEVAHIAEGGDHWQHDDLEGNDHGGDEPQVRPTGSPVK